MLPGIQRMLTELSTESLIIACLHNLTWGDLVLALRIVLIAASLSTRRFMDLLVRAEAHLGPSVMPTIAAWKSKLFSFSTKLPSAYRLYRRNSLLILLHSLLRRWICRFRLWYCWSQNHWFILLYLGIKTFCLILFLFFWIALPI